jgi:hypothetical protein
MVPLEFAFSTGACGYAKQATDDTSIFKTGLIWRAGLSCTSSTFYRVHAAIDGSCEPA